MLDSEPETRIQISPPTINEIEKHTWPAMGSSTSSTTLLHMWVPEYAHVTCCLTNNVKAVLSISSHKVDHMILVWVSDLVKKTS